MSSTDTITLLNRLIVTSKDGEAAIRTAAEQCHHAELKAALAGYSQFFGATAAELQGELERMGETPKGTGTVENTVHRAWMHMKANAYGRDEEVILEALDPDEARVDARFKDALTWPIPPELKAVIERQYETLRRHHDAVAKIRAEIPKPEY